MSHLETDDLHEIAGDAVPGEAVRVRQGDRTFNVTTATAEDDGSLTIFAEENPDESRDETTSTAQTPTEPGNASERANAGPHGDLYAESTDSVYVHDAVNGLWTGFERADGDDLYEDELPDDAVPLHGITHNIYDVREIDRLRTKLTDVEAIAGRLALDLTHRDDRIATAERNWYTLSHIIGAIEDDPAEDVFDLARKVVAAADRADAAEAKLAEFVSGSLQFDYLSSGDDGVGEYADDEAERAGALANIAEMHRLLNLRAERLAEAHERTRAAEAELATVTAERDDWARKATTAADVYDEVTKRVPEIVAKRDAAEATLAKVREFCAERAQYITAINNCHPDNAADYHRWQGGAEARRQLSQRLGLPVAWPAGYPEAGQ